MTSDAKRTLYLLSKIASACAVPPDVAETEKDTIVSIADQFSKKLTEVLNDFFDPVSFKTPKLQIQNTIQKLHYKREKRTKAKERRQMTNWIHQNLMSQVNCQNLITQPFFHL